MITTKVRRTVAVLALAVVLPLLTAAECKEGGTPSATRAPAAGPTAPVPPQPGIPAPAADPCGCPMDSDPDRYIDLHVTWTSENRTVGTVTVTVGGVTERHNPRGPLQASDRVWYGSWNKVIRVEAGVEVLMTFVGKAGTTRSDCGIIYQRAVTSPMTRYGPTCSSRFTMPA